MGYNRSEEVLKAVVGKDGSVVLFEVTNEKIPGEPVQPEEPEVPLEPETPVSPPAKMPKTGDSKTIVVIALVLLIISGGAVLWLRKRGKDEEEEIAGSSRKAAPRGYSSDSFFADLPYVVFEQLALGIKERALRFCQTFSFRFQSKQLQGADHICRLKQLIVGGVYLAKFYMSEMIHEHGHQNIVQFVLPMIVIQNHFVVSCKPFQL